MGPASLRRFIWDFVREGLGLGVYFFYRQARPARVWMRMASRERRLIQRMGGNCNSRGICGGRGWRWI